MATFEFPISKIMESDSMKVELQSYELPDWKGRIRFAAQLKFLKKPVEKSKLVALQSEGHGFEPHQVVIL